MVVHNSYLKPYYTKETPAPAPVPDDFRTILNSAKEQARRIQTRSDEIDENETNL